MEKWFKSALTRIIKNCHWFPENATITTLTVAECEKIGKWTPCDLIVREYRNNGGGSAKGFLGISTKLCIKCYEYMRTIKQELIELDLISESGWNNCGFSLWSNYNI